MKCCWVCNSGNETPYNCNICRQSCCRMCVGLIFNDHVADCKPCFKASFEVSCDACHRVAVMPVQGFDGMAEDKLVCEYCPGSLTIFEKKRRNTKNDLIMFRRDDDASGGVVSTK